MTSLLSRHELSHGFEYPREFLRIVELDLTRLEPWFIMFDDDLRRRHRDLRRRFPGRNLVPFARRQDKDDVACWDLGQPQFPVVIVHDFASPGWEQRETVGSFYQWLRRALEDLIEFE